MRSYFAIFLFTVPVVTVSIMGGSFWPYFSYELYVLPSATNTTFEIWAENSQTSEKIKITNPAILWPLGPNGINQKMMELELSEKSKEDFEKILKYFFKRYHKIRNRKLDTSLPLINKIMFIQMKPFLKNSIDAETNYPIEKYIYAEQE